MNPVLSFTIVMAIWTVSDFLSSKSKGLLSSLFVFNLGIESVQLGIILLVFPALALLRRRAPLAGLSTTGGIAAVVSVTAMVWFVQRGLQFWT